LSKGWRLIDRFSEDIDLLNPARSEFPARNSRLDRRKLAEVAHTRLIAALKFELVLAKGF